MNIIKQLWNEKPLQLILGVGLFFRLLAVIFSKGFGMMDDHFLIIEVAQSWVDGLDQNNWLPKDGNPSPTPSGHSFFYTGLHYFLLSFLKMIGFETAQGKMYIVRLLHAILSMSVIYCGFKITEKISDINKAKVVGLILAIFWFMPFLSVRNLIEVVCIAPLMYATWLVIKNEDHPKWNIFVYAGFWLGIAFCIRFQTILFTGGFGLALMFTRRIKEAFIVGFLFLITAGSIQGFTDLYIWGQPFVEFIEYVNYNIGAAHDYIVGAWYVYTLLLLGILIPPISLFFFFGYFRKWKSQLLLFLPSFIFLVFHSYFPNKQERFILPIVPFLITLGYVGWSEFVETSKFWATRKKLLRGCWIFFWVLNTIPLLVVSVAYSKKNRVEAMTYLSQQSDLKALIIEDSNRDDILVPPLFYLEKWVKVYGITKICNTACITDYIKSDSTLARPNYIVFMQEVNIDKRVAEVKKFFPTLTYVTTIEPSFIDKVLFKLNPKNKNQTSFIYKIK